jgi:hypothetical protein
MRRARTVLAGMGLALALVAATANPTHAAVLVKSNFKLSSEGWTWGGPTLVDATPAAWTGDRARADDDDVTNYTFIWWAPEEFRTSLARAYKGKISFDMEWDSTDDLPRAAIVRVRIYGDDFATQIQYEITDHFLATGEAVETFTVPLRPAGWDNQVSADTVDAELMKRTLGEVELIQIRIRDTTADTVDNTFYLDNVKVKTPR